MDCPDERAHRPDTRCEMCGTTFHPDDPDSELGRAMARAREAGIMAPGAFDEGSIRPTPVEE